MTNDIERPSHIVLDEPEFPYLIDQEGVSGHSYAVIKHAEQYQEDRELFLLVSPEISFDPSGRGSVPVSEVVVHHTFARDFDYSSSSVARFEIGSLQMSSAFAGVINYTGWLTSVRFYPAGHDTENYEHFNPFVGAFDEGSEGNAKYPYLPPLVNMTFGEGKTLPLPVEITLYYDVENAKTSVINEVRGIFTRRAETAERQEQKRAEEEKRAEKGRRDYEEWTNTDEGKVHLADVDFVQNLKKLVREREEEVEASGEDKKIDPSVIIDDAQAYVNSLTDENREFLCQSLEEDLHYDPTGKKYTRKDEYHVFWKTVLERVGLPFAEPTNREKNS